MRKTNGKKTLKKIAFYTGIVALISFIVFPFFIMLMVSFKSSQEAIRYPPAVLPAEPVITHYQSIFNPKIFPFINYFKNSLYVALQAASISVCFGIFSGYALAKLPLPGRFILNNGFYLVYMFSGILLVVPLFKIISSIGLYNHREALIITMIVQTLPTVIYMLRSYFQTIPKEIEEAGKIDGLNHFMVILRIIIPLSLSGIVSVFVYAFMVSWNDFLFASILLSSSDYFTLTIGLNSLFNRPDYIWGRMMAAALVTSFPVVLLYAFSETLMKKDATEGGVKG